MKEAIWSQMKEENKWSMGFTHLLWKGEKKQIIKKSRTFGIKGGPFTIDPGTGVKVPNPQLLNERIRNPVFKSRNPRRKNTREWIITCPALIQSDLLDLLLQ